jgi:hypothetical protein
MPRPISEIQASDVAFRAVLLVMWLFMLFSCGFARFYLVMRLFRLHHQSS